MEILHDIVTWIVQTVGQWGYPGIIVMMFLESSFFPFPSEVVVTPAGYLAARGEMSISFVILAGITGSLLGALFNYWLAVTWGRPFFKKYGRYVLVSEKSLDRADHFFPITVISQPLSADCSLVSGNISACPPGLPA